MHWNLEGDAMLPFAVDRHGSLSLTEQVVVGLRVAIQRGHYPSGATLPTLRETAAELGVSLDVVRPAIRRLVAEGLVTARPRRGIEVCPAGQHRWQAHVLYLHWGSSQSYYEAVSSETLTQHLLGQRVLVTPVQLTGNETSAGHPRLKSIIHAGPVNLAIVAGDAEYVDVLLTQEEVPFVQMTATDKGTISRLARRTLVPDSAAAVEEAVRHAVARGVRSLLLVSHSGNVAAFRGFAEAAGLSVRVLTTPTVAGLGLGSIAVPDLPTLTSYGFTWQWTVAR